MLAAARLKISFIARGARIVILESPAVLIDPFTEIYLAVTGIIPVQLVRVQEMLESRVCHNLLMKFALALSI